MRLAIVHQLYAYLTGMSSNFAGKRLPKDHIIFNALGANDQLSSTIG